MTGCASTRSCSCWSRVSPGDTCPLSLAAHRRPPIAGLRPGSEPGCGSVCTVSCCGVSTPPDRSIGQARWSTAAIFVRFWGAPDRAVAGRPCPQRVQAPSDHRRHGHSAGDQPDRREPQRCHPVVAARRRCRPCHRKTGTTPQARRAGARRSWLRPRHLPPRATDAWHHARDRPARHRAWLRARQAAMGRGARIHCICTTCAG